MSSDTNLLMGLRQPTLKYDNKIILAPMVRIGTLPSRLLALRYGADIVYTEEMVDFKMLKTKRIENELLGTVDFVMDDGYVAFRTCAEEKGRVVFQIGTSHPKRALKVAKMVENDVAGIDINMGCPKTFSISGGMGAALLKQPELVKEILTNLVNNLTIPVTCKIRCLSTVEDTIEFCKMVQSTGIAALGVHGRTKDERPRHKCRYHYIKEISESLHIPVIANGGSGDVKVFGDIEKFRLACGSSSVMVARAAEWNVSIFRKDGIISKQDLIKEYINIAIDYDNHWTNTKFCIQQILGSDVQSEAGTQLLASKCPEDIYTVYGMMTYYNEVNSRHKLHLQKQKDLEERDYNTLRGLKVKVVKDDSGHVIHYESNHFYDRKVSNKNETPKMYLYTHLLKLYGRDGAKPTFDFEVEPVSHRFRCTMEYEGVKYYSNRWHKRKVWSEQAVCQIYMQLNDIAGYREKFCDENGAAGEPSAETKTTADDKPATRILKIASDDSRLEVIVSTNNSGKIIGYSTSHSFSCELRKGSSPVDLLCQHLLEKKEPEPEYDTVEGADGEVACCTLRHAGVEYTNTHSYGTKREAVSSVCQLYLLINKVSMKRTDHNTGGKRILDEAHTDIAGQSKVSKLAQ